MITARPWCRLVRYKMLLLKLFILHFFLKDTSGQAIQDSRCYLMNGGAVESFFVSEDAAVGSVIGTLSVNGDPHETRGNIVLSLREKDAPVAIAPGSKNITLIRPVDREDVDGPSSIYVNVRCERKNTNDPSFVIPVSVRVTDVNDNAPRWLDAPYSVRLSELTAVGSRILQTIRATDADQHGLHSTVEYRVLPGPNSAYFSFVNELDSMLVVKKPLDYESLSNFTIILRAQDQGSPPLYNDTELYVEVIDADDQNPKFLDDHYTSILPDEIEKGTVLVVSPHPITAVDQDVGINAPVYYTLTGDHKDLFTIDKETGKVIVMDPLNDVELPVTLVIKATQQDNADRYALATLAVSKRSSKLRPVRFTQKTFTASVPESIQVGSVIMTLTTNLQRERQSLQYYVSDRSFLAKFAINSAGEVLLRKSLDYEDEDNYRYQVMVTDGVGNDTATLNINVLNVNDWEPRFRYPQYEFFVTTDSSEGPGHVFVGKVEVADGDRGDYIQLSLRGQDANLFYINDMGEIYMREDALPLLNSTVIHISASAVDSGTPPRQTSVPVIVHVSEDLMAVSGLQAAKNGGIVLIIVFTILLSLLALVVLLLIAYIYKAKRSKSSERSNKINTGFIQHDKLHTDEVGLHINGGGSNKNSNGSANNNLAASTNNLGPAAGSLQSISAGASTILNDSNSSLNANGTLGREGLSRVSQRFPFKPRVSHKVTPAPPPPLSASRSLEQMTAARAEPAIGQAEKGGSETLMSDHLHPTSSERLRSGVAWPAATIPARVKKLSWDDDDKDNNLSRDIHDATNPTVADQMNLTVYF